MKSFKLFEKKYDSQDDDDSYDSDIETLCSLIRKFLKNNKIESLVEYEEEDGSISIYTFPLKREKISSMVNLMCTLSRLRKDLLPQYDTDTELFENKEGDPIILFTFCLDVDQEGDE